MIDDGETWDWYQRREQRARKPYKCGECDRVICVGERYEYTIGRGDGIIETHRTCLHCQAAASFLIEECHGYLQHAVEDDLVQHVEEYGRRSPMWLKRVCVGMRRDWKRRDGALMPIPESYPAYCARTGFELRV